MSFPITPSKRPFDRNRLEPNGRAKWQKTVAFHSKNQPLKISPGSTIFRVLCPASKSGSVIGKGGSVVMQIRQETGAKVKVEETVPGCDERVVMITGSDKDAEMSNEQSKDDDEKDTADDSGDDSKGTDENNEDKESAPLEDLQSGKVTSSSAQRALLLVFERIVEGDAETDGGEEAAEKPSSVFVRLLVLSTQVGCLLGKGGSVIKQMAAESGAQIRILPRDKLPSCASPSDELVQITGELDAVRKALQSVSQQLLENPPRDRDSFPASKPTGPSSHRFVPHPQAELYPPANYHFPVQPTPYSAGLHLVPDYHPRVALSTPKFHENVLPGQMKAAEEILTLRLLCMNEKIGGVIGKGGSIIKTLQQETGSDIKILDAVRESDDRIIVISAPAHPDRISAAQEAVLRMQSRVVSPVPDSPEKVLSSRLLVPSNHIGCLLGKGGAIIAEMRKLSGAHIRILGKDQIPKCASDNEEVVQVIGEFEAVQEAMLQITSKLRQHLFRDKFPAMNHLPHLAFPDQVPPSFAPYMERRDPSPPRIYPGSGLSFHKFDVVGVFPPRDERSAFAHSIHKPGFPPHSSERMPSSAPWAPQGISDGGGPIGVPDYAGGPQRRIGGFGGSQSAVITSTTVEVVVPQSVVPSIYGENGGCLKQIRQISGAKITITEPRPEATETTIIISGTPEQTHAAQSLLQAFVLSEQGTP